MSPVLVIACQSGDDDGRGHGLEQHHGHWLKIYFSYQEMTNDGLVTMTLAEATCRTVIKAVVAECKMDDSEWLVCSESFSYYTKLWPKQCIRC
jgi:hypothetical protein